MAPERRGQREAEAEKLQVVYFPHLFYRGKSIEFDGDILWSIADNELAEQYIPDGTLIEYVSKLLGGNTHLGKSIKNVFIFSPKGKTGFEYLTNEEKQRLDDFRRVLFLIAVSGSNVPMNDVSAVTSENFTVIRQNFILGDSTIAFTRGTIRPITDMGWRLEEIKYPAPMSLLTHGFSVDTKLFEELEKLKRDHSVSFERILRATDSMMLGYQNEEAVTNSTRVLMQCAAFEILLDLPEKEQRKVFKDRIEKYCQPDGGPQTEWKSPRGNKLVDETGTFQCWWADHFYCLRNKIIHGDHIKQSDFAFNGQYTIQLAMEFFIVAIKAMINECARDEVFRDKIIYDAKQNILRHDPQIDRSAQMKRWCPNTMKCLDEWQ